MRGTIIRIMRMPPLIDGMGQATPSATGPPLVLSSQASNVIVSGFRADTHPHSHLIRPRCAERAKRGRGKPVLIMHIGFFACFHAISFERIRFSKIATLYIFLALVALKLLVSLISRLVACSARIVVAHRDTYTDTQNDYCNPPCACAPRVKVTRLRDTHARANNHSTSCNWSYKLSSQR